MSLDLLHTSNRLNLMILTLSDVDISNTGCCQDNKAENHTGTAGLNLHDGLSGNVCECVFVRAIL